MHQHRSAISDIVHISLLRAGVHGLLMYATAVVTKRRFLFSLPPHLYSCDTITHRQTSMSETADGPVASMRDGPADQQTFMRMLDLLME